MNSNYGACLASGKQECRVSDVSLSPSRTPLLAIQNLTVTFDTDEGELTAVDGVTLPIFPGEVVGLVGESGCGKSVTAMSILRLIPSPPGNIRTGHIPFNGSDLLSLPIEKLRDIRGKDIGMIFQEPMTALSPLHRIGHQLAEVIRLHSDIGKREAWEWGVRWLEKVGIPDAAERAFSYPFELSGGMRQRVMIAMALIMEPRLIIADEPTTALDVTIQAQILDLMRAMKQTETSLLLITHDMGVIWEMCDRVVVMYASRIVETASRDAIFSQPLHPYTRALLKSMPGLSSTGERLPTIKGQVPSLLHLPSGCHFAERCPYAADACRVRKPELRTLNGHETACFLAEQFLDQETTPSESPRN